MGLEMSNGQMMGPSLDAKHRRQAEMLAGRVKKRFRHLRKRYGDSRQGCRFYGVKVPCRQLPGSDG